MAKQPLAPQSDEVIVLPIAEEAPAEKSPPIKEAYTYHGPVTSFDLPDGSEKNLFPGRSYQGLPTDHPIVSNLIERKLLVAETALPKTPAAGDQPSETA